MEIIVLKNHLFWNSTSRRSSGAGLRVAMTWSLYKRCVRGAKADRAVVATLVHERLSKDVRILTGHVLDVRRVLICMQHLR